MVVGRRPFWDRLTSAKVPSPLKEGRGLADPGDKCCPGPSEGENWTDYSVALNENSEAASALSGRNGQLQDEHTGQ